MGYRQIPKSFFTILLYSFFFRPTRYAPASSSLASLFFKIIGPFVKPKKRASFALFSNPILFT